MIQVEDLTRSFEGRKVLNRDNLEVRKGETMVVIGRSGCGKSVMLKHVIGLLQPDSGRVLIDGANISRMGPRALDRMRLRFGMLFQGAALFDSMTVFENVAFPLQEHKEMTDKAIRQRVHECLQLVGLSRVDDFFPSDISGGMRKRVGLARAIAMQPEYILYDEPTTGIDPIMADIINELIIALRDQLHVTSIVVTHDMVSAYKVADRIAMLYNGSIVEVGTPAEIRKTSNPVVRQFIEGQAKGPIKEGLPDPNVLSRWSLADQES